jgi:hypothetical protein
MVSYKGDDTKASLHRMMSQGINVVVAKTLLSIEEKYDEVINRMESKWQTRICELAADADAKFNNQNKKIHALNAELRSTKKSLQDIRSECLEWKSLYQQKEASNEQKAEALSLKVVTLKDKMEQTFDEVNTNVRSLTGTIKIVLEKVVDHQVMISAIQENIEDFASRHKDKYASMDTAIKTTKSEIVSLLDALGNVDQQTQLFSQDIQLIKKIFYQNVDVLHANIDKYILSKMQEKEESLDEIHVSIDEHNQLRFDLEDQILECNMKYDHILLTIQHQSDESKRRSEEQEIVKAVSSRAKKRRDIALKNVQGKQRILSQIVEDENESNNDEIQDCTSKSDNPVEKELIDHTVCTVDDIEGILFGEVNENITLAATNSKSARSTDGRNRKVRFEDDDDDSVHGGSINLVFLGELNIQD